MCFAKIGRSLRKLLWHRPQVIDDKVREVESALEGLTGDLRHIARDRDPLAALVHNVNQHRVARALREDDR